MAVQSRTCDLLRVEQGALTNELTAPELEGGSSISIAFSDCAADADKTMSGHSPSDPADERRAG